MGHSPWIDALNMLISERMSGPAFEDRHVRVTGTSPIDAQYEFQGVAYGSPSQIPDVEVRKIVARARSNVRDHLDLRSRIEKATAKKAEVGEASSTTPSTTSSPSSLRWYHLWLNALLSPKVSTYEMISSQPSTDSSRVIRWMLGAVVVGTTVSLVCTGAGANSLTDGQTPSSGIGNLLGYGFAAILLGTISAVIGLAISAGLTNWTARWLGGADHLARLTFTMAAYHAPFTLAESIISRPNLLNRVMPEFQPDASLTPIWIGVALMVTLYGVALNLIAVKAVYQLNWGRTIAASMTVTLGLPCLLVSIFYFVLPALTGQIGDVFSR